MADSLDPYKAILGITSGPRPLTLYRLLGIELFESDAAVIAAAADRRRAQLRQAESGPHRKYTPKLLKQVTAAQAYLTDEAKKKEYDQKLRARLAIGGATSPVKQPVKQLGRKDSPASPTPTKPRPVSAEQPSAPPTQRKRPARKSGLPQKRSKRTGNSSRARAKRRAASRMNWVIGGTGFVVVCLLAFFAKGVLFPTTETPPQQAMANSDVPDNTSPEMSPEERSSTLDTDSVAGEPSPNNDWALSDTGVVATAEPMDTPDSTEPDFNEPAPKITEPTEPTEPTLTMVEKQDGSTGQPTHNEAFLQTTGAFFDQHCLRCHGPDRVEGGLRIDQLTADLDDLDSVDHYQNMLDEITVGSMPPEDEPQPDGDAIEEVLEALTSHVEAAKRKHESGGGKLVRRLTKIEYANTVYDLMGVHINGESLQDDGGIGAFDTQADTLYTTDMYFQNYVDTARDAVSRFIASRGAKPGRRNLTGKILKPKSQPERKGERFKFSVGPVPPAGHMLAGFNCWLETAKSNKPVYSSVVEGGRYEVLGTKSRPHFIGETYYRQTVVDWASPEGMGRGEIKLTQVVSPQPYAFFAKYRDKFDGRGGMPDSAARAIIVEFAELMSRGRKPDAKLLTGLNRLFLAGRQQGLPFWEAIVEPMALSMCTIEAMMHLEDRDFYAENGSVSPIDHACRMSYFLWRSAPDSELIELAQSGKLSDPAIISQQVERMMNDKRFDRFLRDFSNQWLELDRQDMIAVDDRLFRKFNVATKHSMKEETVQFMSHVIGEDLPLANLIDSDFAFVNNAMASHYGMPRIEGDEFRLVKLPAKDRRGGILTQAGILMQTGTGDRSSIVERGVFIAKKMMNAEPPPPPPLVAELPTNGQDFVKMTGAELVKKHAHLRQCASCHKNIDPMGLGLEEFDAIGLHRTQDVRLIPDYDKLSKAKKRRLKNPTFAVPLETGGSLVTGERFKGAEGLKNALMKNKQRLAQSYVEGLLTMANGRKFSIADKAIVDGVVKQAAGSDYRARTIVKAVVGSSAFTSN